MTLEEEIQQETFRNPYNRAIVNLIYTYNFVSDRLQKILHTHNLTMQQYNILKILRGQYPNAATNNLIRSRMLDKNSDVTRIIDRLIKEGRVERKNCSNDRRCVNITITQKGLDILSRLDRHNEEIDNILGVLSDDEAAKLNHLLDKIRQRPRKKQ